MGTCQGVGRLLLWAEHREGIHGLYGLRGGRSSTVAPGFFFGSPVRAVGSLRRGTHVSQKRRDMGHPWGSVSLQRMGQVRRLAWVVPSPEGSLPKTFLLSGVRRAVPTSRKRGETWGTRRFLTAASRRFGMTSEQMGVAARLKARPFKSAPGYFSDPPVVKG